LVVFLKQDMRIRWMGPAIPPLVILSAMGLKNMDLKRYSKKWHVILQLAVGSLAALNLVYMANLYKKIDPVPYLSGRVTKDAYIERFRPEFPVLKYANENLKGDVRIVGMYLGNRRYYSDHDIRFDNSFFNRLMQGKGKGKYTHLIINLPGFNKWAGANLRKQEREFIQDYLNQDTKPIFQKNGHFIFSL